MLSTGVDGGGEHRRADYSPVANENWIGNARLRGNLNSIGLKRGVNRIPRSPWNVPDVAWCVSQYLLSRYRPSHPLKDRKLTIGIGEGDRYTCYKYSTALRPVWCRHYRWENTRKRDAQTQIPPGGGCHSNGPSWHTAAILPAVSPETSGSRVEKNRLADPLVTNWPCPFFSLLERKRILVVSIVPLFFNKHVDIEGDELSFA